jgi:hypothetical protein
VTRAYADLTLTPADIARGWTPRKLRAAHALYCRGDRAPITIIGERRHWLAKTRTRAARSIYARPSPIDLDEVTSLLAVRETIEQIAIRLGVDEESITTTARRRGTPAQKTRIARAREEMGDIRRTLDVAS